MVNKKYIDVASFAQLLRMEWTTFLKNRGLKIGMVLAALLIIMFGLLTTITSSQVDDPSPVLIGPGGEAVTDKFYFVHKPLTGSGSITVRLTSMTGLIKEPPAPGTSGPGPMPVPGVVPWAKAGIMIKDGVRQGASYVAVMATAEHGVRMQHNFTHDTAGQQGGVSENSPRWLRLTREGDTLTGYESYDGKQWIKIDTIQLDLPDTVQIGMFAASPGDLKIIGGEPESRFSEVTAVFDQVSLQGPWSCDDVGVIMEVDGKTPHHPGGLKESGDRFIVTGVGDIAPRTEGDWRIEHSLIGVLFGLITVIIVAVLFSTTDYRRSLSCDTHPVNTRQDRVLIAKAVVMGTVTFVVGLASSIVTVLLCRSILLSNSIQTLPVTLFTELRIIFGTAALLAVAAIFALALTALFRRSVTAAIATIALVVLPMILTFANVLTLNVSQWLLSLTPAAGFAVQQSIQEYPHVIGAYFPKFGYYPLAPWAGFAVLCGYTAIALGLASFKLHSRDTTE